MISLTNVTSCAVEKVAPGSLALFPFQEKWLKCLAVKRGSVTLLALGFPTGGTNRPFLMLQGIGEQCCVVLGKAEFRFELDSISHKPSSGHLMLGPNGPSLLGQIEIPSLRHLESGAWSISTGEPISVDRSLPTAGTWEVGLVNSAGEFEKVLSYRGRSPGSSEWTQPPKTRQGPPR